MLAIAILAAGKGTRMKSSLPKVLHTLAGKTLIQRVLESCLTIEPEKCFVIVGHESQQVKNDLKFLQNLEFVEQEPQNGTGHAVQQLIPKLKSFTGDLLVLNGDVPLLRPETIKKLLTKHTKSNANVSFLTAYLKNPSGYGRVFADSEGNVEKIVEHKDCSADELKNCLTNAGIYCFKWNVLSNVLSSLSSNNKQKEIYLTDAISKIIKSVHINVEDPDEIIGINNKLDLATCEGIIQKRLRNYWMKEGVTFTDPSSCTLSDNCNFGNDILIEPQTHIRGNCTIGDNTIIGPDSLVINSQVGNNVQIIKSVISDSTVYNNIKIGPFAHIRPETKILDGCKIGNFVEIKNSELAEETKVNHLSYIGDSTLGKRVNIGAGTITANYDGRNKHKTIIGDEVRTGSNSVLVAPIVIGSKVIIAAGSTITKNAPDNSLVIARAKQFIKENWFKKYLS